MLSMSPYFRESFFIDTSQIIFIYNYPLTSGRPATLVSTERRPARSEAEITTFQSTADSIAEVPMVATAVWATVLTARTAAALSHFAHFVILITYLYATIFKFLVSIEINFLFISVICNLIIHTIK